MTQLRTEDMVFKITPTSKHILKLNDHDDAGAIGIAWIYV